MYNACAWCSVYYILDNDPYTRVVTVVHRYLVYIRYLWSMVSWLKLGGCL
jgi:hypothetical protein